MALICASRISPRSASHFAVVLQDPFLFTGTMAENIRLGNEEITEAALRQAARDVNVLDFIETLARRL